MRRIIEYYLSRWKTELDRKPLLIRGARQIGKTYSIRELGKQFSSFVEINFDLNPQFVKVFDQDLEPERILRELSIITSKQITPGKTLLFFDELQKAPNAILSLRYFYEKIPELHIIAAGSLLDFALESISLPVGRVTFLRMYPMSYLEFLFACGQSQLMDALLDDSTVISQVIHESALRFLADYLFIGGMPSVVNSWRSLKDPKKSMRLQDDILDSYRQDFVHYSKKYQQKYVDILFQKVPCLIGKKFVFSSVQGDYRKRELQPALDLLSKAGVVHIVYHASGQGIPLGSEMQDTKFKCLFLDCGLTMRSLGTTPDVLLSDPELSVVNKGEIVEVFTGQEILSASSPYSKAQLYYWHREARSSNAEVDYLIQKDGCIIPVEVKSGNSGSTKSMNIFLDEHSKSPYGLCFSKGIHPNPGRIKNYPVYRVSSVLNHEKDAFYYMMQ